MRLPQWRKPLLLPPPRGLLRAWEATSAKLSQMQREQGGEEVEEEQEQEEEQEK